MLSPKLYKIYFNKAKGANEFVNNEELKRMNLIDLSLRTFQKSLGIIKGIPTKLSDNEILENIVTCIKITSVHMFRRTWLD